MKAVKRNMLFTVLVLLALVVLVYLSQTETPRPPSSARKYLSESTQRKIFYDMTATQDQNPYSNEWNQGVREAAAKYYNVPMSEISNIIQRGATEGWLQPDPP